MRFGGRHSYAAHRDQTVTAWRPSPVQPEEPALRSHSLSIEPNLSKANLDNGGCLQEILLNCQVSEGERQRE